MDNKDINPNKRPELGKSAIIEALPKACSDELLAVEFIEARRWGDLPCCPKCGDTNVYKMVNAKTGGRSKRFLWRCRGCKKMYTVRTGTVFEESLIPLRHWCYAFWRVSVSKKGVAAMEIMRQCQITYKSALFMLHRIRFGLAPKAGTAPKKLKGIVECDETYVGGKPRRGAPRIKYSTKRAVFGAVSRGGDIHRRTLCTVTGRNIKHAVRECVSRKATLMTDEANVYRGLGLEFRGGHHTVMHTAGEYARGNVTTNTIESSFAILKRGLMGIHHAVSKDHLHRYLAHYDFLWNTRKLNDGERADAAFKLAEGKG